MRAILRGQVEIASGLLLKGADANHESRDGSTPLMVAARLDGVGCLRALIAKGARVNASNKLGNTALMVAAFLGRTANVDLLLAHGADRTIRNSVRDRARDQAFASGRDEIASKL